MANAVRSKLSQMNNLEKEVLLSAKAEKVEMTLNTESALASGLLIQRLTELYENPIEASVRETISNAIDAVTEAHSGERPEVRVSAPTSLSPILIIKDNGVGMTYDDLKEIYSKYGASTKANNLEQIGAYGLGAKAPLAYGTEFTVTSVKDGQKTTIIVAREEMTNYIKIVDSISTDESSGTTVSIPVSNYDIDNFNKNINKYKETPIDKDVDLYISGKLIDNNKYTLITDNALILDGLDKVYGRVWINSENVISLITDLTELDIRRSVKYIIGGWSYDSPTGRGYYRNTKGILVELKAGIVGFNSSRDAILANDRYTKLEDLIVEYVKSEQFMKDLTKGINKLNIEEFKNITGKLLNYQRPWAKIEDNKIIVDNNTSTRYNSNISRTFKFEDFTHEETGFNLNQLLNNVPKFNKSTIVIREKKDSYYRAAKNAIMDHELTYAMFEEENVSTINTKVDEVLNEGINGHRLDKLMINLAALVYDSEKNENMKLTFITDLENEDQIKSIKSGRKAIVRMRNQVEDKREYNSILVYTKHTKSEINKMIENVKFDNIDLEVNDAEELLSKLKKHRAENKVVRKEKKEGLSTSFSKYDLNEHGTSSADINAIDKSKHNIVIVTRNYYVDKNRLKQMHIWYCNENDYDKEDVQIYVAVGNLTINDIKLLTEVGEVMRDPQSDQVGQSQLYKDTIHDNIVGLNAVRNDSVNSSEKAMLRLITGIFESSTTSLSESLEYMFNEIYKIAEVANIELPEFPATHLAAIADYDNHTFSDMKDYYSNSRFWKLEPSAIKHLLSKVDSKHHELVQNLTLILCDRKLTIDETGDINLSYNYFKSEQIDLSIAESAYGIKSGSNAYNKLLKAQIEIRIEFFKSIIEEMSLINF